MNRRGKSNGGTEPPADFAVEFASSWKRWAKALSDDELAELAVRLRQLVGGFGRPHRHAGLGVRNLRRNVFEFRLGRDLRVVFLWLRPGVIRLAMVGNHDAVRTWLRGDL